MILFLFNLFHNLNLRLGVLKTSNKFDYLNIYTCYCLIILIIYVLIFHNIQNFKVITDIFSWIGNLLSYTGLINGNGL